MKFTQFLKRFLVGLALVTFIAGCAGTSKRESTGEYFDDSAITTKVKADIFKDPMLKVLQINVESFKGVVQLSGFVDSRQASDKAVQVAASVKGVKAVKNSLVIK
jgi:osmotically-inducible protein OsmY